MATHVVVVLSPLLYDIPNDITEIRDDIERSVGANLNRFYVGSIIPKEEHEELLQVNSDEKKKIQCVQTIHNLVDVSGYKTEKRKDVSDRDVYTIVDDTKKELLLPDMDVGTILKQSLDYINVLIKYSFGNRVTVCTETHKSKFGKLLESQTTKTILLFNRRMTKKTMRVVKCVLKTDAFIYSVEKRKTLRITKNRFSEVVPHDFEIVCASEIRNVSKANDPLHERFSQIVFKTRYSTPLLITDVHANMLTEELNTKCSLDKADDLRSLFDSASTDICKEAVVSVRQDADDDHVRKNNEYSNLESEAYSNAKVQPENVHKKTEDISFGIVIHGDRLATNNNEDQYRNFFADVRFMSSLQTFMFTRMHAVTLSWFAAMVCSTFKGNVNLGKTTKYLFHSLLRALEKQLLEQKKGEEKIVVFIKKDNKLIPYVSSLWYELYKAARSRLETLEDIGKGVRFTFAPVVPLLFIDSGTCSFWNMLSFVSGEDAESKPYVKRSYKQGSLPSFRIYCSKQMFEFLFVELDKEYEVAKKFEDQEYYMYTLEQIDDSGDTELLFEKSTRRTAVVRLAKTNEDTREKVSEVVTPTSDTEWKNVKWNSHSQLSSPHTEKMLLPSKGEESHRLVKTHNVYTSNDGHNFQFEKKIVNVRMRNEREALGAGKFEIPKKSTFEVHSFELFKYTLGDVVMYTIDKSVAEGGNGLELLHKATYIVQADNSGKRQKLDVLLHQMGSIVYDTTWNEDDLKNADTMRASGVSVDDGIYLTKRGTDLNSQIVNSHIRLFFPEKEDAFKGLETTLDYLDTRNDILGRIPDDVILKFEEGLKKLPRNTSIST